MVLWNIKIMERPDAYTENLSIDPYWLAGFTTGDGTFNVSHSNNRFRVKYSLTQHERDFELLQAIKIHAYALQWRFK